MPGSLVLGFKERFALTALGLATCCAYLQALALSRLIAAAIEFPVLSSVSASTPPAVSHVPPRVPKSAKAILSRNAFDSITGPIGTEPPPSTGRIHDAEPDLRDPLSAMVCDGTKVLIVTESTDPTWSAAALKGPGDETPRSRRVGDNVAGKQVAYIGYNPKRQSPSVWLLGGATVCQTLLFAPATPVAAPTSAERADSTNATGAQGAPKLLERVAAGIHRVSETEFHLARATFETILGDQGLSYHAGRIVPDSQNGRVVGVRLLGLRQESLPGLLGLKNGDRLETINGFNLASPERALEAYARLRTADSIKLQLTRGGQTMEIDYRVH